jgi:hypothetical protein
MGTRKITPPHARWQAIVPAPGTVRESPRGQSTALSTRRHYPERQSPARSRRSRVLNTRYSRSCSNPKIARWAARAKRPQQPVGFDGKRSIGSVFERSVPTLSFSSPPLRTGALRARLRTSLGSWCPHGSHTCRRGAPRRHACTWFIQPQNRTANRDHRLAQCWSPGALCRREHAVGRAMRTRWILGGHRLGDQALRLAPNSER